MILQHKLNSILLNKQNFIQLGFKQIGRNTYIKNVEDLVFSKRESIKTDLNIIIHNKKLILSSDWGGEEIQLLINIKYVHELKNLYFMITNKELK